jgi:hypothetical protein
MNERIKLLWEQSKTSGVHSKFGEYDKYSAEKFAELIVRECAGIALKDATPEWDWTEANTQSKKIAVDIKQHFGLKE